MIQNLTYTEINSLPPKLRELYDEAKEITSNFKPMFLANKDIAESLEVIYEKITAYLDKNKPSEKPKKIEILDEDAVDVLTIPKKKKADYELTILEYIQNKYPSLGIKTLKDAEKAKSERNDVESAFSVHEILVKDAYEQDKKSVPKKVLSYYPHIFNPKKTKKVVSTNRFQNISTSDLQKTIDVMEEAFYENNVKPTADFHAMVKELESRKTKEPTQKQTRHLPMVVRKPQHAKDKEVKANDLESQYALTFVKSFLLMIGKKKLRKNLQSLLNRINKAADKKEIRAKSIHAEAVKYVAESLVAALNTDYATFVFKLDKIGSEVLEPYMNAKEALPNKLLRSFYNSQNKKFTTTHSNLLKRLEKIENQDNPFGIEISQAIKVLKKAQQNKTTIQATKPTLRGLEGLCKKKSSLNGFKKVTRKAVIAGATSGAIGGMIGTILQQSLSGVELLEVDYETMDLSFDFSKVGLDDMPKNASILVYGKPKHGKSTFALQLANELSKKGSLLYVANEEMMSDGKPSKSLQDRVKRIGYTNSMRFSKNLNVPLQNFQFIVIDSINALGLDIHAWRDLRNQYPNSFFVLVSQVTKSGVFRGSQEWAHDVDVIVDVKHGKADIMGRFGSGEYEIFDQNII
jgi:hypothetical protein